MEEPVDHDDECWEQVEEHRSEFVTKVTGDEAQEAIMKYVKTVVPGSVEGLHFVGAGAFNIVFKVELQGNSSQKKDEKLHHDVLPSTLESMYTIIAKFMLQLWEPSFSAIGAIDERGHVRHRPLALDMNELVQLGGLPRSVLPQKTFNSSEEYFVALAQSHLDLYRRLHQAQYATQHFKLFNDDLDPSSFLLNEAHNLVGVIDWEYTNALPADFALAPPWSLLLCRPESHHYDDIERWARAYSPRLNTFLSCLRRVERERKAKGGWGPGHTLSEGMQKSWDSGDFWIIMASRRSFIFDPIFWRWIAPRFFGKGVEAWRELYEEELSAVEKKDMELLVKRKKREMEEGRRMQWDGKE
ncbi:MAG: hypothetical protein Q9162_002849 [Coniocarpon cinnabarinum]